MRIDRTALERNAPVEEVDLAEAPDHHVRRLHVAVEDATAVDEVERLGNAHQDLALHAKDIAMPEDELLPQRVRAISVELAEARALDPLHHKKRRAVLPEAERVHRDDARVLERAGDARLVEE